MKTIDFLNRLNVIPPQILIHAEKYSINLTKISLNQPKNLFIIHLTKFLLK